MIDSAQEEIEWNGLPPIAGLSFRHLRGASDYAAIVAVTNRSFEVDQIDEVMTREEIKRTVELLSHDSQREFVIPQVNDQIIGWGRVSERLDDDGSRQYLCTGCIAPEWRRKGIGGAMFRYQEYVAGEMAHVHVGQGPQFLRSPASDARVGKIAMLEGAGYQLLRVFNDMLNTDLGDLVDASLPPGLELRPLLPEHYRLVWEANEEIFRDHWGHSPQTEEQYRMWFEAPNFDPTLQLVAWEGDRIAGAAMNLIDAEQNAKMGVSRGIVDSLGVRRPWRRQGLAHALLVSSLHALKERGMTQVWLGVDTENQSGALHLYESVGFRLYKRHLIYSKPLVLAET